jgi:hypothetical protein
MAAGATEGMRKAGVRREVGLNGFGLDRWRRLGEQMDDARYFFDY